MEIDRETETERLQKRDREREKKKDNQTESRTNRQADIETLLILKKNSMLSVCVLVTRSYKRKLISNPKVPTYLSLTV